MGSLFFTTCTMGGEQSSVLSYYISRARKDPQYEKTKEASNFRDVLFGQMDSDKSGEIDKKEAERMWKHLNKALKQTAKELKLDKSQATMKKETFFALYDKYDNLGNSDGLLDFDEFVGLLSEVYLRYSSVIVTLM